MKVFKFGGASIRDAASIRNMAEIVQQNGTNRLVIVVSAMGKTTNAFEEVLRRRHDPAALEQQLQTIALYHAGVAKDLFDTNHEIFQIIESILAEARESLAEERHANEQYDHLVSFGELLSSRLILAWLSHTGLPVHWADARSYILTDDHFREGQVLWDLTSEAIRENLAPLLEEKVILTQGFVGGTPDGRTTTLGREGSDFTAAIFATCLQAESVTVWKDVDGIMNGDPKRIRNTVKFNELPYREAAEMTYYGASVIHPKTIKPLANAHIPLYVKSFFHPDETGTVIRDVAEFLPVPATILKEDQCLVSFYVRDFTFVNEQNLSLIFHQLSETDIRINMMQNSAISFSVCVDFNQNSLDEVTRRLKGHFSIRFNTGLRLITIKHYTQALLDEYRTAGTVLLEQLSRNTCQLLVDPSEGDRE